MKAFPFFFLLLAGCLAGCAKTPVEPVAPTTTLTQHYGREGEFHLDKDGYVRKYYYSRDGETHRDVAVYNATDLVFSVEAPEESARRARPSGPLLFVRPLTAPLTVSVLLPTQAKPVVYQAEIGATSVALPDLASVPEGSYKLHLNTAGDDRTTDLTLIVDPSLQQQP